MPDTATATHTDDRFQQLLSRLGSKSFLEGLLLPAVGIVIFLSI